MTKPTYKPKIVWTGELWRCVSTGPCRSNSGWGNTLSDAYADWIMKLQLDGLYWEFFA